MPNKTSKDDQLVVQAILKMSSKLDALDSKLISMDSKMADQGLTLVKQEENIGEHMRRTAAVEEENRINREDIKDLKSFKSYLEGAIKGIGIAATLISLIFAGIKAVSAVASFFHLAH